MTLFSKIQMDSRHKSSMLSIAQNNHQFLIYHPYVDLKEKDGMLALIQGCFWLYLVTYYVIILLQPYKKYFQKGYIYNT